MPNDTPTVSALLDRLRGAVRACAARGETPIVVWDLDSTVFQTGPRHQRIFAEFAAQRGDPALLALAEAAVAADFSWSVDEVLLREGVDDERLLRDLRRFWGRRFFDGDYLDADRPYPGAVRFVRTLWEAGATSWYLTGRLQRQQAMGTLRQLVRWKLPILDGGAVLHLRPPEAASDQDFKASACDRIDAGGTVVATFENEPGHANHFARRWPEAVSVLVDTTHKPGAPEPEEGVVCVAGWGR